MKSQKGYVQIVLVIFVVLLGLMIFPTKFPKTPTVMSCVVGEAPENNDVLKLPAGLKPLPGEEEVDFPGGPNPGLIVDYVPVRTNVPVMSKDLAEDTWAFFDGEENSRNTLVGEVPEKPGYELWYPKSTAAISVRKNGKEEKVSIQKQGLVFFRSTDPETIKEVRGHPVYLVDVYQEKDLVGGLASKYNPEEVFGCIPNYEADQGSEDAIHVAVPGQTRSEDKKQMQLEWFTFTSGGLWAVQ